MLLQKMEVLLSKTPDDDVRLHLLPLMYNALRSESGQIQVTQPEIFFCI